MHPSAIQIRPSQSLLPTDIYRVAIHYHPARHRPDQYATITSPPVIQNLVHTFNSLGPAPEPDHLRPI